VGGSGAGCGGGATGSFMNRRGTRPGLGRIAGGWQENTLGLARLVHQHV